MSLKRRPDLICLSHPRWSFVFQRPQHLLSRCAKERRVFFFEEPVFGAGPPRLETAPVDLHGVCVLTPHLPAGTGEAECHAMQRALLDGMLDHYSITDHVLWYYTPMAVPLTRHLAPIAVGYDCMDELSAFTGASASLAERTSELLRHANLVFTGGQSLHEAKRALHPSVHLFPSSVDVAHFSRARGELAEPADQASIPRPRIGFFGVIDERLDVDLIRAAARLRPSLQIVLAHLEIVLAAWADRYAELGARDDVQYVFPFENRGVEVGVTIPHPHGQIYAYPFIPPIAARELAQQRDHLARHGRGLLEDHLRAEIEDERRLLYLGAHAAAFVPVCARYAYEIWIAPRRAAPSLTALDADERADFARALKTALLKLDGLWGEGDALYPGLPSGLDRRRAPPGGPPPHRDLPGVPHARAPQAPRRERGWRGRLHGGHAARTEGGGAPRRGGAAWLSGPRSRASKSSLDTRRR